MTKGLTSDFGRSFNDWILPILRAATNEDITLTEADEVPGSLVLKYSVSTPISDISALAHGIKSQLERREEVPMGTVNLELFESNAVISVLSMPFMGRVITPSIEIYEGSKEIEVSVISFQ